MNYNEKIVGEYGAFIELNQEYPVAVKPRPRPEDYKTGIFVRAFAKRINGSKIIEISIEQAERLNADLYRVVVAKWTISGVKENRYINGALEYGVSNNNQFEIERIRKEQDIDLSTVLTNPLEYWRGY
jgi:hypothetical protein